MKIPTSRPRIALAVPVAFGRQGQAPTGPGILSTGFSVS